MKHQLHFRQCAKATLVSFIAGLTLISQAVAEGKPVKKLTAGIPVKEEPAKKAKTKVKSSFASLNNEAVKIYPDIIKRDMHVVAKENEGKEIEFLAFDMQGTLVQHYKMKAKDHYRMTGLSRGTYIYRVFSGDEEITTGKFEIR